MWSRAEPSGLTGRLLDLPDHDPGRPKQASADPVSHTEYLLDHSVLLWVGHCHHRDGLVLGGVEEHADCTGFLQAEFCEGLEELLADMGEPLFGFGADRLVSRNRLHRPPKILQGLEEGGNKLSPLDLPLKYPLTLHACACLGHLLLDLLVGCTHCPKSSFEIPNLPKSCCRGRVGLDECHTHAFIDILGILWLVRDHAHSGRFFGLGCTLGCIIMRLGHGGSKRVLG